MKNIALCFYGLSGGLNDKNEIIYKIEECFKSIKTNIVNDCNFDIFFHTWKNNKNNDSQEEYLVNLYKPKNYIIENKQNFINEKLDIVLLKVDGYLIKK